MHLELTADQADAVRRMIRQCDADSLTSRMTMGQFMPDPFKFLIRLVPHPKSDEALCRTDVLQLIGAQRHR